MSFPHLNPQTRAAPWGMASSSLWMKSAAGGRGRAPREGVPFPGWQRPPASSGACSETLPSVSMAGGDGGLSPLSPRATLLSTVTTRHTRLSSTGNVAGPKRDAL